jgi:predicted enzyme related to lactoylglutathione lyase
VVMLMVVVRDIDATFARVKALGAPVVTRGGAPVHIPLGLRAVVVQDPAGHFVELLQPRDARRSAARQPGTGDIRNVQVRHTVENLDRAIALYRDALGLRGGLKVPSAGHTSEPRVVDLLGVPRNTSWRYTTLTVPTSDLRIELIEFKDGRRPLVTIFDLPTSGLPSEPVDLVGDRRPMAPGATLIQFRVADLDAAATAFVDAGGTLVSTDGEPRDLSAANGTLNAGIVRDADGLFVMLFAPPQ